jgi:hypothetical protein
LALSKAIFISDHWFFESLTAPIKTRLAVVVVCEALDALTTDPALTRVSAESGNLPTSAAEEVLGKSVSSSRWGSVITEFSSTKTTSSLAWRNTPSKLSRVVDEEILMMGFGWLICSSID